MNEIKKGDWVYVEEDEEHIFQCSGTGDGVILGGDDFWFNGCCHLLEPLKPDDKLEVGDRVAVIGRPSDDDPDLGTIHRIVMILSDGPICPVIDSTENGWAMLSSELARLPDFAQDKRCDPEESATPKAGCHTEAEVQRDPVPCPRPEWEGIWDYLGDGYRVEWKHVRFVTSRIHGAEVVGGWAPGEFWKQIEPAPNVSTPGKKLERPRTHGGIKTPWDPCEI